MLHLHTRESVLERVTGEYNALEASLAKLSPADWKFVLGEREGNDPWTVKDALAHITYWKADRARRLRGQRRKRGEAPRPTSVNEFNHVIYEEWRDRPLAEVLKWHRSVQAELVAAIEGAPDDLFSKRERSPTWPRAAVGHSAEHRVKDLEKPFAKAKE